MWHLLHGGVQARGPEQDVDLHGALGGDDTEHWRDGEVVVGFKTCQFIPAGVERRGVGGGGDLEQLQKEREAGCALELYRNVARERQHFLQLLAYGDHAKVER